MTTTLRIDYVSDVACPWCAIGLAGLEEALRRTRGDVEATLAFQPFELNPDMPAGGANLDQYIGSRYRSTPAQLEQMRATVRERAAGVGFAFNSSGSSRVYNTFDAHRLLHWAGPSGHQLALKKALFKANFTDDADVSDHAVLARIAASVGLDEQQALRVLQRGDFAEQVRAAEQEWISRGIQAVPGMVINGKWLISGGQPPEVLEQALRDIARQSATAG